METILTKEDCEKILMRSIDYQTKLINFTIKKLSDKVVGYMGDHLLMTIKFSPKDKENEVKQLSCFLKTLPIFNKDQLQYVLDGGIFKKEVLLYQNLLGDLLKISEFGPKCYYVKDNCIVLENLNARGYKIVDTKQCLGEDLCESIMDTLGKYHAATMIYEEERNLRINEKFQNEIKEVCFSYTKGTPRQRWCVNATQCVIDLMKLTPNVKNIEKISEKHRKFVFEEMPEFLKPSKKFRNVLTHDDLWCNNMMFCSNKKCLFVDYQMARYTPPAFDVLLALYINLTKSAFDSDFEKYKNLYYTSLQEELKRHGYEIERLYSKNEFNTTLNYYKLPALVEACMYGTHVFIPDELSEKLMSDIDTFNDFYFHNRSKFLVAEYQGSKFFRDRINNILVALVDMLNE